MSAASPFLRAEVTMLRGINNTLTALDTHIEDLMFMLEGSDNDDRISLYEALDNINTLVGLTEREVDDWVKAITSYEQDNPADNEDTGA